ncbi:MAG: hypothetical protein HEP71_29375 [Roseivirga sp.]|nr:hypothetical protein [Roseivirga sp.]
MEVQKPIFPHWMRGLLLLMAAYNVLWAAFIVWFPSTFYEWVTQVEAVAPPVIKWQGRAVLLMGLVYFISALHPGRFWYLMVVGALTKLGGAIWFYFVILEQQVGDKALFHLIMNDAIWIPFLVAMALRGRQYASEQKLLS